ncbi:hypothetical protein AAF712_002526 [Marasmius tenuissimus]|uniref:Uncharacterized protein n=1 Tax=Marasmius tenuissimus TaxID=585030 RepID=A0ABR3ABF2_9AGAR
MSNCPSNRRRPVLAHNNHLPSLARRMMRREVTMWEMFNKKETLKKRETSVRENWASKRYIYLKDQLCVLLSKYLRYVAGRNGRRAKVVRELYDELIKIPMFRCPTEKKTPEKTSLTRWFENHWLNLKTKELLSVPKVPSGSLQPALREESLLRDQIQVKAFTNLFNKPVNGILTMKNGREPYRDANLDSLERTLMAEEDADADEVTSRMWDALDVKTQEHWEKVAAEGLPILE